MSHAQIYAKEAEKHILEVQNQAHKAEEYIKKIITQLPRS